jgi:hypothetical protein
MKLRSVSTIYVPVHDGLICEWLSGHWTVKGEKVKNIMRTRVRDRPIVPDTVRRK